MGMLHIQIVTKNHAVVKEHPPQNYWLKFNRDHEKLDYKTRSIFNIKKFPHLNIAHRLKGREQEHESKSQHQDIHKFCIHF
jgi:hypothetical protein